MPETTPQKSVEEPNQRRQEDKGSQKKRTWSGKVQAELESRHRRIVIMRTARPKVLKNDGKQRLGRGFSREELKRAGSNLHEALRFGMPVDAKRKTVHEENVEAVKIFLQEKKPASKLKKPRGKPKS